MLARACLSWPLVFFLANLRRSVQAPGYGRNTTLRARLASPAETQTHPRPNPPTPPRPCFSTERPSPQNFFPGLPGSLYCGKVILANKMKPKAATLGFILDNPPEVSRSIASSTNIVARRNRSFKLSFLRAVYSCATGNIRPDLSCFTMVCKGGKVDADSN
jgi:hypothetical protein